MMHLKGNPMLAFIWKRIPHPHLYESKRGGPLFGLPLHMLRCKCGRAAFIVRAE